MAKKAEKKISVTTLKKAVKESPVKEQEYTINVDDEPVKIVLRPNLTIAQYIQLINDIVAGCVDGGEYTPALRDLSEMSQIINYCTNISTDNIAVLHDFIHSYQDVANRIYNDFVEAFPRFEDDVRESIDFEVQKYLHSSSFDLIADKIVGILDTIEKNFEGASKEDISKLMGLATELTSKNDLDIAKAVLNYQKENTKASDETK